MQHVIRSCVESTLRVNAVTMLGFFFKKKKKQDERKRLFCFMYFQLSYLQNSISRTLLVHIPEFEEMN